MPYLILFKRCARAESAWPTIVFLVFSLRSPEVLSLTNAKYQPHRLSRSHKNQASGSSYSSLRALFNDLAKSAKHFITPLQKHRHSP